MEIDGARVRPRRTRRPWPWPVTLGVVLLLIVIGYTALQGSQWPASEAWVQPDPPGASRMSLVPSISITLERERGVSAALVDLPDGARAQVQFTAFTGAGCDPSALAGLWSRPLDVVTVEGRGAQTGSAEVTLPWPWGGLADRRGHSWRVRVVGDDAYAGSGPLRTFDTTSACRSP